MSILNNWLVKPHQTETKFLEWGQEYPHLVELDSICQYVGLNAYSITLTDKSISLDQKEKLIFAVPHAHEPAGTAACMNYINQILTGKHLDQTESEIYNREEILQKCVLTFLSDPNPDGRSRSPVDYWDGTKYTNEEFWTFMRGRDPETKKMWKRMDRWSIQNENPETIGIVYEQVSSHEYVEPNRDFGSAYFRLIKRAGEKYGYGRWLDLHQTEFEKSKYNAMIILPIIQNELPEHIKQANVEWADAIVDSWKKCGAQPMPESKPLGYTGQQAEYFKRTWREFMPIIPKITTEIQNNNLRTPPEMQEKLEEEAIKVSVDLLIRSKA
ncbi:hypothetical protein GF312_07205 [Candidatus Poribacteria bacterium]|nr:hypothetical protein [Candidatus Poribacteria bacterium]